MMTGQCPRCGKILWPDGTHTCNRPRCERVTPNRWEDGCPEDDYTESDQMEQGFRLLALDGDD